MWSGSSMASRSCTTWFRLSPTYRCSSNRVGRSIWANLVPLPRHGSWLDPERRWGTPERPPSQFWNASKPRVVPGRDHLPASAPTVTGVDSPAGPADQLVASHLRGPTTTVVHVWTTSFLRSAHQ